jgi:H+/Cl- antiporter ClcA
MKQTDQSSKKNFLHVIIIGIITAAFTGLWLGIYNWLNVVIWSNDFVQTHHFMLPLGVVIFSLLIGLSQKYLKAPNMIHSGGLVEALSGKNGEVNLKTFPGALIVSYLSILSGVSIGPEGSIGLLVTDIVSWFKDKFSGAGKNSQKLFSVGLASAYNGIIGSPLFTGVLTTEIQEEKNMKAIIWNLLGGIIGFVFFTLLHLHVFAKYIPFSPISSLKLEYFIYAFLLAFIGATLAIFVGVSFQFSEKLLDQFFKNKPLFRILTAGGITAIVVYFFPEVMFAGETQIFPMIANPASYGILLLLFFAVIKIILMSLSFKSGFIGGPTFPILFSSVMIGLALSLIFPWIPVSIIIPCIEVSAFSIALEAPLTAILLVAVINTSDANATALLILSAVTGIGLGNISKKNKKKQYDQ